MPNKRQSNLWGQSEWGDTDLVESWCTVHEVLLLQQYPTHGKGDDTGISLTEDDAEKTDFLGSDDVPRWEWSLD